MLKVLSLNLWNDSGPYERRRERIREWVQRLDPDVVGLQEVVRGDGIDTVADQVPSEFHIAFGATSRFLHALDGFSAHFFDAWAVAGDGGPGYTWSNHNDYARIALDPDRRIDYVFVGYPIRDRYGVGLVERCQVVCDDERDGVWPSDHFGVYAELRTEPLEAPDVLVEMEQRLRSAIVTR